MKRSCPLVLSLSFVALFASAATAGIGSERWFYCVRGHRSEADFNLASNLVERASKAGYNGILYAGGLDTYCKWSAEAKARFQRLRNVCTANGIEVVPLV